MKKILLSSVLLAVLALAGCASVPMATPEADQKAKTFTAPSTQMASLYIFRDSPFGAALTKKVKIDGQEIGDTASGTYFHIFAKPGKRTLSTESEFSDNHFEIALEAGKAHFVRNYIKWSVNPFSYKESGFYLKALPSHVDAVQTAQAASNCSYCVVGHD